jgi:hypothetical protein
MMASSNQEIDIAKNIRVIEWLKTELLGTVSTLFRAMLKGSEEVIMEALAGIVIMTYVLARRLGINFARLDIKIESKLRSTIKDNHEVEQWYGDLTAMLKYVSDKKR